MDLFLDDPNGLPKIAAAFTRLSENADEWTAEILNELYRQSPFIGDFEPKLVMNELDPERRYAMGSVELRSKQAVNPRDDKSVMMGQGAKQVLIPLVVRDGKMSPLDVFIHNGKAQPLTEKRLQRAMFRPEMFEAAAKRPGDQDMMSTLYPPDRSGGMGLGGNSRVGSQETAKTGSARPELLDAVLHTVKKADVQRFEQELNNDHTLRSVVLNNPATLPFVVKLAAFKEGHSAKDMLKIAMMSIRPKVIQVSKVPGGFLVKTANPDALLPEENEIDRPTAEATVGSDVVKQVERDGTVTMSTNPVVKDSLVDAELKVAEEFGEYKVQTKDGKELVGWIFPKVIDLDGTQLALSVFSNGSESALQEKITASSVGKSTNIIDEAPSGFGCFYLSRAGSAVAIVPLTIKGESQDPDMTTVFHAETVMGEPVQIRLVPGINAISQISDGVYGIPDDCGWLPMRNMTELAENAGEFGKTAALRRFSDQVQVMFESGGTYSLRGASIEKLATVVPVRFINEDRAVYDLAILGVEPKFAKTKLAQARHLSDWINIDGVRPVTLASEKYNHAKTAAATFINKLPQVKSLLLKEAAALDDPLSVDKVLSIGFLNHENIGTFISYIPEFEVTLNRLSELLVSSRLGLSAVDTGALERVVKHLDKVIDGLRDLSQSPQA